MQPAIRPRRSAAHLCLVPRTPSESMQAFREQMLYEDAHRSSKKQVRGPDNQCQVSPSLMKIKTLGNHASPTSTMDNHTSSNLIQPGQPCQPIILRDNHASPTHISLGQPCQPFILPDNHASHTHISLRQPCQPIILPDNQASPTYINLGKPCLPDKVPKAPKAPDTISLTTHTIASSSHQQQGSQRPQRTIPVCSDIRSPLQNLHNQMLIYDVVKNTGVPNYLGAKIPLPHSLNMDNWRIYLHNYVDHMSKCHMQKFVKFFSYYWTSFFLY